MTIDEAINILEDGDWWEELGEWYIDVNIEYDRLHEAIDMAIKAMKEKKQAEKNDPLTMEEICDMETGPIYVVRKDTKTANGKWYLWNEDYKMALITGIDYDSLDMYEYGEKWIAYLRKPEEVNHG